MVLDKQVDQNLDGAVKECLTTEEKEETITQSTCRPQHKTTACSERCVPANPSGWIKTNKSSEIPPNAVIAGHTPDGSLVYVGRYVDKNQTTPGKVIQGDKFYFVLYDDKNGKSEMGKGEYEILTGTNYTWISWHRGLVPPNAVVGGKTKSGEKLYIGRALLDSELGVGTIYPSDHHMHLPFKGIVRNWQTYEVLVYITTDEDGKACCPCNSTWMKSDKKCMLKNAVPICGGDSDGFVGRALYKGDTLPAAVSLDKNSAYMCHDGWKVKTSDFEILTGQGYSWEMAENGGVPLCAVEGGRTTHGETLYIGRKYYFDKMRMGMVQPSEGCMFIAVDDVAVPMKNYEVLVYTNHKCPASSE